MNPCDDVKGRVSTKPRTGFFQLLPSLIFHFFISFSQFFSCSGNVYLSLLFLTEFPRMDSVILICGALVWKGRYTLHTTAFPPTLDSPALFGLAFLLRCSLDFFPPHFLLLITFTSFVSTQVGIGWPTCGSVVEQWVEEMNHSVPWELWLWTLAVFIIFRFCFDFFHLFCCVLKLVHSHRPSWGSFSSIGIAELG